MASSRNRRLSSGRIVKPKPVHVATMVERPPARVTSWGYGGEDHGVAIGCL